MAGFGITIRIARGIGIPVGATVQNRTDRRPRRERRQDIVRSGRFVPAVRPFGRYEFNW
ncbi:hypothetical protein ACFQMM_10180 [Saliphagus sp. GCM10025308]